MFYTPFNKETKMFGNTSGDYITANPVNVLMNSMKVDSPKFGPDPFAVYDRRPPPPTAPVLAIANQPH